LGFLKSLQVSGIVPDVIGEQKMIVEMIHEIIYKI
jgi:hypothetical protein